MQTESMMRLLRKDESSPSGYRIVGKLAIDMNLTEKISMNDSEFGSPDAFELGIGVGLNNWWFDGDRGENKIGTFVLYWDSDYDINKWWIRYDCGGEEHHPCNVLINAKRIGTIHDKEEK